MPALRLSLDARHPDAAVLRRAVDALAAGEVVAFPTDTLYGLAVDPRRPDAGDRLFAAKHRPAHAAAPLVAAGAAQIDAVARWTPLGRVLAARFWPGALALVLDAAPVLDRRLLGGGTTVAVRVPAHPVARALAAGFGFPVTATSANLSGHAPASDAGAVMAALGDDVSVILDAGPAAGGAPSTIVDVRGDGPVLVREGAVPWDRVLQSLP